MRDSDWKRDLLCECGTFNDVDRRAVVVLKDDTICDWIYKN